MNVNTHNTGEARFAMPALPGDNRRNIIRYLDDVTALRHMASILDSMMDKAFDYGRAISRDPERTVLTFNFSESWISDLQFAISDIDNRAEQLVARSWLFESDEDDPLVVAVHEYREGLARYNREAPDDSDGADAFIAVSYGPPMIALENWTRPAITREGAIAALEIAVDEMATSLNSGIVPVMVKAALGYLEGAE